MVEIIQRSDGRVKRPSMPGRCMNYIPVEEDPPSYEK